MSSITRRVSYGATTIVLLSFGVLTGWAGRSPAPPAPHLRVVETGPLRIDRLYPSMTGPSERVEVDSSGLDWIVAVHNEVIDAATGESMGGEFFCHSQLQIRDNTRLAVAATGMDEIRFPPGFGIHVRGLIDRIPQEARKFTYFGMVLNNHEPEPNRVATIRATLEYLSDEEVGTPPRLKRLYSEQLAMTVESDAAYGAFEEQAEGDLSTHCALVDGRPAHWIVPPGEQRTRNVFHDIVPTESTVHLALAHMHNQGEWVRLTDLTTGDVLWQTNVDYEPDRRQIERIPVYSSEAGFRVYPDHDYQLDAFYDNMSAFDVDAMAVLYLYYHPVDDRELQMTDPG